MNPLFEQIVSERKDEKEFAEALKEFLSSIEPLYDKHLYSDDVYRKMVKPDHVIAFDVDWVDDLGNQRTNKGYRVQFNNVLGPYKGGLRFHPSVNLSILKMLGFEQTFKNCLTGLPMGGGKGGSDFDPKGKSDAEVIRFCKAFMNKLAPYIGSDKDVPAGDIGVGGGEIRAMYEEYVKITGKHDCSLTGKPLDLGGSLCRTEATGYGLCYIADEALAKISNSSFKGKTVIVSGSGNVATYAAEKAVQLGAKVLAMSDSTNSIYDKDGVNIKTIKQIKEGHRGRIKEYLADRPNAVLMNPKGVWGIKADIVLPCATQFEIDIDDAKKIVSGGATIVAEGANMPCTKEASRYFIDNDVIYLPGKASNAGGVAVSGLEMIQNANHEHWSFEEVNQRLKTIMVTIFHNISETARDFGSPNDFVMGANTYSFITIQNE